MPFITFGVHAQQGLQYLVCVSVCLCVCVSVTQYLTFQVFIRATNHTLTSWRWMKVGNFKRFSLKMLCCEARAFPIGMAT